MKKLLVMMLVTTMAVMMLAGCGNETENVNNINTSEMENSQTESEIVSEEVSEETTEEVSEEVAEEETYSAQEVMDLIDELTAKYQYNDPEHIKTLVIGANLDYIPEEELNIILDTYGYTMEDLAAMFVSESGVLYDVAFSFGDTYNYYGGGVSNLDDEQNYANRIMLESIMLNENDKMFAIEADKAFLEGSQYSSSATATIVELCDYNAVTSGEKVVVSYAKAVIEGQLQYGPYEDYQ